MSRVRAALLLAAALVPIQALAATEYMYRHVDPPPPSATASGGQQAGPRPVIGATSPVYTYRGVPLDVPAPQVANLPDAYAWGLLMYGQDVSGGLSTFCPGLSFNAATGAITGTPTNYCNVTMNYRITVPGRIATATSPAQDPYTVFSGPFPLTVDSLSVSLTPSSTSIRSGNAAQISATTTLKNPTWSVSGAPPWMTFSASGSGYVGSGTSASVGQVTSYPIVFTARSGQLTASATSYLTVEALTANLPVSNKVRGGNPFSIPLSDPGFEVSGWSVVSDTPDISGLAITNATLVGTPAVISGNAPVQRRLSASLQGGPATVGYLSVYPKLSASLFSSTVSGTLNQPYTNYPNITANNVMGTAQYTTTSALPAGLRLDPNTGMFQGTPTEFGTYYVTVLITDSGDNSTTNANVQLNIVNPQDIAFYQHTTSSTYLIDFGNPGQGANGTVIPVTIRNQSAKDATLSSFAASGDASDPEAFGLGVPGSTAMTHSGAPGGTSSVGGTSPASPPYCQAVLRSGYYCYLYVRFAGSGPGTQTGSLTVTTQNGNSTIPLKGVSSGFVAAGSALFPTVGSFTRNLGAARPITFRFVAIGGGNAGQTNGSYGGNSGVVAYGDAVTDASGNLAVNVGPGSATYQSSNGGGNATSSVGAVGKSATWAYATGANAGVGWAGGGTVAANAYDGLNGATGQNIFGGAVYKTIANTVDPRYGYPSNQPFTSGFKFASFVAAPGGQGHSGIADCGVAGSGSKYIVGGGGGGGGINALMGAPGGGQTLVGPSAPAAAGAAFTSNLPGQGGQGFGAGGGGSETQTGACANGHTPWYGTGGAGAQGMVYVEWDAQ